jgi:myo-inositol 2-dehydrogenase / D-chiro-inositol 1-dehydrogenase
VARRLARSVSVGVGVIGAGIMGADHVRTLHRFVSGAAVTMVADVDVARAHAAVGEVAGARTTEDPLALIADPAVDAVVIASHDATHADLAIAAADRGKPVLCEKPLAPTVAECLRVMRAGGELVSVGFMRRFDPGYVELKEAIDGGACGPPLLVHCVSRGVSAAPGATAEATVTGSAIHELDVVPWLLAAPIVEVAWHAPRPSAAAGGLQDPQLLLLRTADGVLTTVEAFLNARYGYDIRCEVVGERGTVALANSAEIVTAADRAVGSAYPADWRPRFADAYRLELQAWVDAIVERRPSPLAGAHDGLVATAAAEAAIASMHRGGGFVAVEVPALEPSPA